MDAIALIEKRLAAPKIYRVVTTYADGKVRVRDVETIGQAENWAIGERANIGHDLIDRMTGKTIRKVSVDIIRI